MEKDYKPLEKKQNRPLIELGLGFMLGVCGGALTAATELGKDPATIKTLEYVVSGVVCGAGAGLVIDGLREYGRLARNLYDQITTPKL